MSESAGQAELFAVASGFLMRLNEIERAAPFLAAYDMRCEFDVLDGEPFHAVIADGRVAAGAPTRVPDFSNRDDFALFGYEAGFRLVFDAEITPAVAMYTARVTPRGERAKHCQAAVIFTLLHLAQLPRCLTA
jgi:hypothetical protein